MSQRKYVIKTNTQGSPEVSFDPWGGEPVGAARYIVCRPSGWIKVVRIREDNIPTGHETVPSSLLEALTLLDEKQQATLLEIMDDYLQRQRLRVRKWSRNIDQLQAELDQLR